MLVGLIKMLELKTTLSSSQLAHLKDRNQNYKNIQVNYQFNKNPPFVNKFSMFVVLSTAVVCWLCRCLGRSDI